ncbi:MAG: NUDIX hydrolase [Gemmatimonadales bacterium]
MGPSNRTFLRLALPLVFGFAPSVAVPSGTTAQVPWTEADTRRVVDNVSELWLDPDLSQLSEGERIAVANLVEAGKIFQELYEDQNHPDAIWARMNVRPDSDEAILYRLYQGPIATNGSNQRVPFLPVRPERPGRNVYPLDITPGGLDRFIAAHPSQRDDLLDVRTVVRRATEANLLADRAVLEANPWLRVLHPELSAEMDSLRPSDEVYYAVPYAVAYAGPLLRIRDHLLTAADAVAAEDRDLAAYLRLRAADLLTSNYEGGDAAWVSGQFVNVNAQIGSYETYDDALYGVKAFYSLSLLARDRPRSDELAAALTDIQAIENSLPYARPKTVRSQIPVGVYNVVADFGQARGTNTATILPNDADHARKYGRTILLRYNIMTAPQLFEGARSRFCAAVAESHCSELSMEGNFQRTLWHEIGHYLGVDRTDDGRALDDALGAVSNLYEEMKADLVSLFSAERLHRDGHYTDRELREFYAGGILRVLQAGPPRRDQPYQTMQLMQWNWYLDRGMLTLENGRLRIHYDRYPDAVESLLREVLAVQASGDPARAEAFIDAWTTWDPAVHGVVAAAIRGAAGSGGFWLVRYGVLDR